MFDRDRFDDDDDWFDLKTNQRYLALLSLGVFVSISNGSELSHDRALSLGRCIKEHISL